MYNLLLHELFSRRMTILGWGVGLALFGIMYIAMYPQMEGHLGALNDIPLYQSMGISMGSLEGYLASAVIQFTTIMAVIYVVLASTDTLAGEEDKGTLELILTLPLPRRGIISMKALALVLSIFFIMAIAAAGCTLVFIAIQNQIVSNISPLEVFIAILSGMPILVAFLMMGLFFGAILPNRRTASMALTLVVLVSYFGKILAISLPSLDSVKPFFLFTHFDTSPQIFADGPQIQGISILLGLAVVFFVLALLSFERRDITVGLWPWQRAKQKLS